MKSLTNIAAAAALIVLGYKMAEVKMDLEVAYFFYKEKEEYKSRERRRERTSFAEFYDGFKTQFAESA